jgi:DNA polymerase III epsilon subunit-like protein
LDENGNPSEELVSYKDDAMAINGLTVEKLIEEGYNVHDVICMMEQFIIMNNIKTIIGHNAIAFDIPRIDYLVKRFGNYSFINELKKEDTMLLAKSKLNLPSYKLESLCAHFGIDIVDQHTAKGDVMATIELYKKLI